MNKKTFIQKSNGDTLEASEWNELTGYVNEAVDAINAGGSSDSGTVDNSFMYVNNKGNLCIETTTENTPVDKKGKINIESRDDIQVKPGDDFTIVSSHRPVANMDEVSVKIHDGEDHPVKLQLNAADIVLTTKDKDKTKTKDENGEDTTTALYDDPTVMNVTVNSAKNTRGYLKVRAQAIDLRCEENGGIAIQPKGTDGSGHENKIKFEHNGGDGKEFGTFNTEKTSIFTDEYRFNKNGTVYAVTRGELETTYKVPGDPTSGVKKIDYPTQSDDFKDIITQDTPHFTWEQIFEAIDSAKRVIDVSSDSEYFNQSQQVVELIPQAVLERFPFELIGRRTLLLDDGSHLYNATVRREMVNPLDPSDGTCIYTIEAVGTDKKIQIKVYSNTPQPLSQGVTKATYCEAEIGQSFPTYNPAT